MRIPEVVALNSERDPSGSFYIYSDAKSGDIVTITHFEFGRATHRAAQHVRAGHDNSEGEVVAILALSDTVLSHAILVGLMTANFIPFPMSPRNSAAGIYQLLRASSCHRILATCVTLGPILADLKRHISEVDPSFELIVEEIPALTDIYPNIGAETPDCPFEPYPVQTTAAPLDDIAIYTHSSGSTGFPKAIPQTHRALEGWANLPAVAETRTHTEKPIGNMALPSFHLFGLACQLLQPLHGSCAAVYPPTATSPSALPVTPTPDNILEHARKTKCRSLTTVPVLLAAWFHSPAAVEYLKTLHTIVWSGGPLQERIGDSLAEAGVNLLCGYGSTEVGAISAVIQYEGDEKEWRWFRPSDLVKVRWAPQGDGTFECQVLTWEKHTPMVENLPDVRGYAMSDLCVNHPTKHHLWRMVGRLDDVLVHTFGEKTVPAPMEDVITSSPLISGAVIFGHERPQTGILVEVVPSLQVAAPDPSQLAEIRNKIWPVIEEANQIAPAFSRIFKEMIVFASPEKPLPRAGKGTVLRKAALTLYASEIESIYTTLDIPALVAWDLESILSFVRDAIHNAMKTPVGDDDDIFLHGCDSLRAAYIRNFLLAALRESAQLYTRDTRNFVYEYPTISRLARFIFTIATGGEEEQSMRGPLMRAMVEKYVGDFPEHNGVERNPSSSEKVVLVTGTTGELGCHLLSLLLADDTVVRVYALNRSSPQNIILRERQANALLDRGLDPGLLDSPKLSLLAGDVSSPRFGLSTIVYQEIQQRITHIIHNAWPVDFNLALPSFEPNIKGLRQLVDFSLRSPFSEPPKLLYTSSSGIFQHPDEPAPLKETPVQAEVAIGNGYLESKWVSEGILNAAAATAANPLIIRVGQLSGGVNGAWNTHEWVPALVQSAKFIGCIPDDNRDVTWLPVNIAAVAIIDLLAAEPDTKIVHLVNPHPVSWSKLAAVVAAELNVALVPYQEWLSRLEAASQSAENSKSFRALRLLPMFQAQNRRTSSKEDAFSFARLDMSNALGASHALRSGNCRLTERDVKSWLKYWQNAGLL